MGAVGGQSGASLADPRHTLRRLFTYEQAALEEMLATVSEGKVRSQHPVLA